MNVWEECQGHLHIQSLHIKPWRVVEAQHLLSTRQLVDSLEEHEVLENLIESSKPPMAYNNDYLLFTPFRYPPLAYGSRFGRVHEPSLWYGSLDLETAFAEVSFYIQKFRSDTLAPLGQLNLVHTAFKTNVLTKKAIKLDAHPFDTYRRLISDPNNYECSQVLGKHMRQASIEAFTFFSARTTQDKLNIAVYTPEVFIPEKNKRILNQQTWLSFSNLTQVEFTRSFLGKKMRYCFTNHF